MKHIKPFLLFFAFALGLLAQGTRPVQLSWGASTSPPAQVAGYSVSRGTSPAGPFTVLNALVSGLTFTDSTAVIGSTYTYAVATVGVPCTPSAPTTSTCGTSSAPATATTTIPQQPVQVTTVVVSVP